MNLQITERVLIVFIGAACIFAVACLLMGWSAENFLLIISFIIGTFFPSPIKREITTKPDD